MSDDQRTNHLIQQAIDAERARIVSAIRTAAYKLEVGTGQYQVFDELADEIEAQVEEKEHWYPDDE